jgi:hypothetical protein
LEHLDKEIGNQDLAESIRKSYREKASFIKHEIKKEVPISHEIYASNLYQRNQEHIEMTKNSKFDSANFVSDDIREENNDPNASGSFRGQPKSFRKVQKIITQNKIDDVFMKDI